MAQNVGKIISKTSDENTISNVTATTKTLPTKSSSSSSSNNNCSSAGGKKKIRRAFSMPRNPFRLSRRFKTGTSASSGKELQDNNQSKDQVTDIDGAHHQTNTTTKTTTLNESEMAAGRVVIESSNMATTITNNNSSINNNNSSNNKNRLFRRTSWKKFLSRIAQQMTSINIGVSLMTWLFFFIYFWCLITLIMFINRQINFIKFFFLYFYNQPRQLPFDPTI